MSFSEILTSFLIIIFGIFILSKLMGLSKNKKLTSIPVVDHFAINLSQNELTNGYTRSKLICKRYKTLTEIKEDLIFKQGRDQIRKLVNKKLNMPVTFL